LKKIRDANRRVIPIVVIGVLMGMPVLGHAAAIGPVDLGVTVRANFLAKDWDTRERRFPLETLEFDMAAPNLQFQAGNWRGAAQYRLYYYSETDRTTHFLHHAWLGYQLPDAGLVKAGVTKVPFGVLPYASHNYFFSLAYYVGLEDDYDLGISYNREQGPWRWDLAYFATDEGSYHGSSANSARYSYDVVREGDSGDTERHQLNARIERTIWKQGPATAKLGASFQYGRIPNNRTERTGDHTALAGHFTGRYGQWSVKFQTLYYNYDLETPAGQSDDSVTMGAYDFGYQVAAEGHLHSLGVAYDWPVGAGPLQVVTFYNDYSVLFKPAQGYRTSQQNVTGMALNFDGPLLVYADVAVGKNNAWIGPDFGTALGPGGATVDDAAPVAGVLSVLRLADHPDDTISRYHVASTPLGELLGYRDHTDDTAARRMARHVRGRLLRHGYGPTIAGWVRDLAPRVSAAELRRLRQLVELGFRWQDRPGLRPDEFVQFARTERVADPREAAVQVMTVHQAKGLEFDAVFLPDLEESLTGGGRGGETALPERDLATGRIRRVFPYVKTDLRPLVPEVEEAVRQHRTAEIRDALSWLYVAVTRARHSLRLLVAGDGESGPGTAKTPARVVRAALGCADEAVSEGEVLYEEGDPRWHEEAMRRREEREDEEAKGEAEGAAEVAAEVTAEVEPTLRIDPERPRTRMLGRRSPSDLEGGDRVEVSRLLRLDSPDATRRGSVVHRWCQELDWIEDGLPGEAALLRLGHRVAPELGEDTLEALARRFRRCMDEPAVRKALSRRRAVEWAGEIGSGTGAVVEVATERRFAFRHRDEVISGLMDRLVLARSREGGPVVGAEVLDFKTDDLAPDDEDALADRVELYRPQIQAYRRGIASLYGLEPDDVAARLLFLAPGVVRNIE
jgi:hypothetical protein